MPAAFPAGTTLEYTRSNPNFPASQGWSAVLYFAGKVSTSVAGVAVNDSFKFLLPSSGTPSTAGMTAGIYQWAEWFTHATYGVKDGDAGYVTVLPRISAATGNSMQLHLEKVVELLEARLEGRLASGADMDQYSVDGTLISKIPFEKLMQYRNMVREQLRSVGSNGSFSRKVLIQFTGTGVKQ